MMKLWGKKKSEKQRLLQPFDLSEEVEDYPIGCMNERTFSAGDVVVSEGDPGDSLHVMPRARCWYSSAIKRAP